MILKCKWSKDGLWYTKSHKDEEVVHLIRIGATKYNGVKIYELIIGKLWIGFALT